MGCAVTKSAVSVSKPKDGVRVNDSPVPPFADPRLPLTTKQRFNILTSWKGIARAMESTGVSMFINLFQENVDLLNLFSKFQSLSTQESQKDSMELAFHASVVMATLDEGLRALDRVDYFLDYLGSVGRFHRKINGFKKEYFWKIEQPFLVAVQETLGDRYTSNMENIYKITIHFILESIVKGYNLSEEPRSDSNVTENYS
ncbi:neuroglobin-like [Limulus polyphemus]|uniref:Neuroglobin-like n=1 Tax=Limulus polyphemus TaxID=6850 RepID=A0ABM1BPN5_LIMPO|nr:neuroglobin-like [Limulus polyphemus]